MLYNIITLYNYVYFITVGSPPGRPYEWLTGRMSASRKDPAAVVRADDSYIHFFVFNGDKMDNNMGIIMRYEWAFNYNQLDLKIGGCL